ncbi:hypothetical protein BDQ17DRAFT_1323611 [Cyathus striatus]|nr:hypothetical protein BDQ17DRAFT_1323611 [Cyathus striatus]
MHQRSTSKKYIGRAREADPNNGRCLVENTSPNRGIQYCHVLPNTWTNPAILDSLELSWGMRKGSLKLDTRYNIFPVGVSLAHMYEKLQWILIPDNDIVQTYYDGRLCRTNIPEIKREHFVYRLFPVQKMCDVALIRQDSTTAPLFDSGMFTVHTFPFNTLPDLISHIHPKFAIMQAGYVLSKTNYSGLDATVGKQIMGIYQCWTTIYSTGYLENWLIDCIASERRVQWDAMTTSESESSDSEEDNEPCLSEKGSLKRNSRLDRRDLKRRLLSC